MTFVLWIAVALLTIRLLGELWLGALNRGEVRRHATRAPAAVSAIMDDATYAKAVRYTLARSKFSAVSEVFGTGIVILALASGVLPWLFLTIVGVSAPDAVWSHAVFILAAFALLAVPSLPFDWWETFHLEARHGFNQTTPRLWLTDKAKAALLAAGIGFPLLWLLLSLVHWVGDAWWLWGFAVLFVVQLSMIVLYPKLILPLFNKLTPLPEGELRARLIALGERAGFRAKTIEVIDGSKRSGHSNAYFTGFGRFRRIVLFDTLIAQLGANELEAVLAHEIGHYRRGHIPKMIAVSALMQLAGFASLAWLARSPWFDTGFGFPAGALAPAFLLFGLLSGVVTFWFSPVLNFFSRKHEYEADAFARESLGDAGSMIGALRKLAQKNLTNLTPHPWFSAFFYSHPTLVERERALQRLGEQTAA